MSNGWNYRVIEFTSPDGDPWRAIHEVHYSSDGRPTSYAENPASVGWSLSDGDDAADRTIERMREALTKPVLKAEAFASARDL